MIGGNVFGVIYFYTSFNYQQCRIVISGKENPALPPLFIFAFSRCNGVKVDALPFTPLYFPAITSIVPALPGNWNFTYFCVGNALVFGFAHFIFCG